MPFVPTMKPVMRNRWLLVAVMMLITFLFGTDLFSSQNTGPIVRWILRWFLGDSADTKVLGSGEGWLRKSAHFMEYGLLAWVWLRALRGEASTWTWSWAGMAWLAATLWATVDELQQGFISSYRTGSPWDVLIDSCGAATAILVAYVVYWISIRLQHAR